ncbi:hypothetical protein GYMLUDRAFT_46880, partial [Collybiopsis luxurians FD-317 M1]
PINHGSNKKTFTQLERHLNKKCKEYANSHSSSPKPSPSPLPASAPIARLCPSLTFDCNPGYNFVTANECASTVTTRSCSCMVSLLWQELFYSSHAPRFQIPRSFTVTTRTSSTVTSDSLFS